MSEARDPWNNVVKFPTGETVEDEPPPAVAEIAYAVECQHVRLDWNSIGVNRETHLRCTSGDPMNDGGMNTVTVRFAADVPAPLFKPGEFYELVFRKVNGNG